MWTWAKLPKHFKFTDQSDAERQLPNCYNRFGWGSSLDHLRNFRRNQSSFDKDLKLFTCCASCWDLLCAGVSDRHAAMRCSQWCRFMFRNVHQNCLQPPPPLTSICASMCICSAPLGDSCSYMPLSFLFSSLAANIRVWAHMSLFSFFICIFLLIYDSVRAH